MAKCKTDTVGQSPSRRKSQKAAGLNIGVPEVAAAVHDEAAEAAEPSGPGPLPYMLLEDNAVLSVEGDTGLQQVQLEGDEAWVLRLPAGMALSLLHGRTLHLPGEPPDARHLQPPPNPFEDPAADLLAYVRAHVPPTTLGHVALPRRPAAAAQLGVYRELTQEDEFVATRMFVVGPRRPATSTTSLALRQAARFIAVGDDLLVADRQRLAAAMEEGLPLWGPRDGWDGRQADARTRKRVAGWKVVDRGVAPPPAGAASDEEFDEEVFGARLKNKDKGAAGRGAAGKHGEQQQQQEQQEEELEGADADDEAETDPSELLDPRTRFYSEHEQQEQEQEEEERLQEELLAGFSSGPQGVDIQQFLLSLPIKREVAEQQQVVARIRRKRASKARKQAAAQQHGAPRHSSQQQQKQRGGPQPHQATQPSGNEQQAAASPGSAVISELTSSDSERDARGPGSQSEPEPSSSELDDGVNWDSLLPPYEPPVAIPLMLSLPAGIQESLAVVAETQPDLARQLRNACHKRLVNWVDVAQQVDTFAMSDADTDQLLALLPLTEGDEEGDTLRRQQVSRLLLPRAGPGPRPHYSTADQGYAPYQPSEEPPVVLGPAGEAEPGAPEDAAVADWLMEAGAGKRARLIDTTELRNKGFAWDSDPEQEQHEGLQVVTASGRVVHIP